jgi:hypothetical protein
MHAGQTTVEEDAPEWLMVLVHPIPLNQTHTSKGIRGNNLASRKHRATEEPDPEFQTIVAPYYMPQL